MAARRASTAADETEIVQLAPSPLQKIIGDARTAMNSTLIERDEEIDLGLVSTVSGENFLMVGPPGTAKSLLAESLCRFIDGQLFSYLLTKYSTPDELFGPLMISKLQLDEYERKILGYLPTADIVFLDEIWKASSAINNTLLRVTNEGTFLNNTKVIKTKALAFIAASNEYPNDQEGGKELGALFDRFIIRKNVEPIRTPAGRRKLLWEPDLIPVFKQTITPAQVLQARAEAAQLPWEKSAMDALETILADLARLDGIKVGDRRQRKAPKIAQVNAYLLGDTAVKPEHLEILGHVFWTDPVEQPRKAMERVSKIANPVGAEVVQLLGQAQEQIDKIPHDASKLADFMEPTKKIGEILKRLKTMKETDKVKIAIRRLTEQLEEIKATAFEKAGM